MFIVIKIHDGTGKCFAIIDGRFSQTRVVILLSTVCSLRAFILSDIGLVVSDEYNSLFRGLSLDIKI